MALIGGVALALRLAHQSEVAASPLADVLFGDGAEYDAWARRITSGDWVGTQVFYQSPLYPYFLACVYALTDGSVQVARLTQALLGAASCVLLGVAGRAFFDQRTGLLAAAALALFPWAIFAEGLIQKSGLDGVLMTSLLACLGLFARSRRRPWLWAAGFALAALALNRETARLLYPLIVLWLARLDRNGPWRVRAAWIVTISAAAALVTVPVALRNYHVGGEFLVSTSQLGPNAYIGNHAGASGTYEPLVSGGGSVTRERADATRLAEGLAARPLSASEVSAFWLGEAFRFIREDPAAWLRLVVTKASLAITADEVVDTESIAVYAEHSRVLWSLSWFSFGWVVVLATLGAIAVRPTDEVWVVHGVLLAVFATLLVFYVVDRYRYPMVPAGILLGAAGLSSLCDRAVSRRRASLAVAAAVLAGVGACLPATAAFRDPTLFNVAMGHIKAGVPTRAVPWLEEETRRHPEHVEAFLALGHAYADLADRTRATAAFRSAVHAGPDDWRTHAALGAAVRDGGSTHAAVPHLREAVRLNTAAPELRVNLALALAGTAALEEAERVLLDALTVAPTHIEAHDVLVALYEARGDARQAEVHLRQSLARHRDSAPLWVALGRWLQRHGRSQEALVHARAAVAAVPSASATQMLLVKALLDVGQREDATRVLEDILRMEPAPIDLTADLRVEIVALVNALRGR